MRVMEWGGRILMTAMWVLAAGCGEDGTSATADTAADATADAAADTAGAEAVTAGPPEGCLNHGTEGATARCLSPVREPAYYEDEALKYFDTLDVDADRSRVPAYSDLVVRWEWPPWLLLTGFDRETLIWTNEGLLTADPSTIPTRDCRFFDVQPFARCYVTFVYEEGPCPIYEEFTFNDQGETTFIEAWSDLDGLRPTSEADRWGEAADFPRLSTRVPGLGNATGLIDLDSAWMQQAAANDPDVADLALRASDQWKHWLDALNAAPDDFFALGCGW